MKKQSPVRIRIIPFLFFSFFGVLVTVSCAGALTDSLFSNSEKTELPDSCEQVFDSCTSDSSVRVKIPDRFLSTIELSDTDQTPAWQSFSGTLGDVLREGFPLVFPIGGIGTGSVLYEQLSGETEAIFVDGIPEISLFPLGFNMEWIPAIGIRKIDHDQLGCEMWINSNFPDRAYESGEAQKPTYTKTDVQASMGSRRLSRFGLHFTRDLNVRDQLEVIGYSFNARSSLEIPGSGLRYYRMNFSRKLAGTSRFRASIQGGRITSDLLQVPGRQLVQVTDPRWNQKHNQMNLVVGYTTDDGDDDKLDVRFWYKTIEGKVVQIHDRVDYEASRIGLLASGRFSKLWFPPVNTRVFIIQEDNPDGGHPLYGDARIRSTLLHREWWDITCGGFFKHHSDFDPVWGGEIGLGFSIKSGGRVSLLLSEHGGFPSFSERFYGGLVFSDSLVTGNLESTKIRKVSGRYSFSIYESTFQLDFFKNWTEKGIVPVYRDGRVFFTTLSETNTRGFSGYVQRKFMKRIVLDGWFRMMKREDLSAMDWILVSPEWDVGGRLVWNGAVLAEDKLKLFCEGKIDFQKPQNDLPADFISESGFFAGLSFGFAIKSFSFQYKLINLANDDYRTIGIFSRDPYSFRWEMRWILWD